MRIPKPTAPADAPPGTVTIGGPVEWFKLALCVRGPDLEPAQVTLVLGVTPNRSVRKGQPIFPSNPRSRISDFGLWELSLDRNATDEWDVDEATKLLLARVPATPQTWRRLSDEYIAYLDIAASLTSDSSAFSLSPALMGSLAERHIEVRFDIYDKSVPSLSSRGDR